MIERLTFINCSMEAFDNPWLSHQQIMSRLSQRHSVMYVTRESTLDDARAALSGGRSLRSRLRVLAPNIHELRPTALLPRLYFSSSLDSISTTLRAWSIRRAAAQTGGSGKAVLYFWNPHFVHLVGRVGEAVSVFHMHDYHPGFAPEGSPERALILRNLKLSLERADVVIACSEALLAEAKALGRHDAKLVENGVDFQLVSSGASRPLPTEFAKMPRPIVGHIGRINRKLDMDAITRIARTHPEWSVVLMGPRTGWSAEHETRFQEMISLANVHYLPGRGWDELPAYFNALDVGLMAYRTEDTWMSYGFPLKVWEYFSLGKAVVGSDLVSLRKFSPLLGLVPSNGNWVGSVESALKGDTADLRSQRIALARTYDWTERARIIEGHIFDALAARRGK